jgi:GNAT superfamily N-acetyltransferase
MALRIDRYPNFFELNKLRGKTNVYVAVENNLIVGSICVSDQRVYINQKEFPLFYISDFKVAKTHRNIGIGFQLTNEVVKYLESQNADFAFLNVSKGNKRPFVFFSDRSNYPDFQNIGIFKTFQFIGSNKKIYPSKYKIEIAEGTHEVLKFLNNYYSRHELASVITRDEIEETNLFLVRKEKQIIAVMCIIDTMKMKQNVVLKLPLYLKLFLAFINGFSNLLQMSKLPKENEPIKMLYIKYLAVREYDKSLISMLISQAKQYAFNKSYSFVSIGLHERDPLIKKLPKFIRFTFYSVGMLVSMKDSKELMDKIKKGVPFKDYSIV